MAVTTLAQALELGASAATYDSQLQLALAQWQAIAANTALLDTVNTVDSQDALSGDATDDTAASDATTAIALLQAEIARIGG